MGTPMLRQFGELWAEDFDVAPVWVHCLWRDEHEPWYQEVDEETFRPWDGSLPVSPHEGTFLVAARFTLAGGSELSGFVTPQPGSWVRRAQLDVGILQPHVFTRSGHLGGFWLGISERIDPLLHQELATLGEEIFPIRFEALPGLCKGIAAGTLEAFYRWSAGGPVLVLPPSQER